MGILNIRNLTFKDKDNTIVDNVSLIIERGECISIVGESGSGKSTLLRLCADLISPSAGSIEYNNKNYLEYNPVDLRRSISYCTQTPYLFGKDVYENLCFPFKIRNKEIDNNRIYKLLIDFSLDKSYLDKDINLLSGGEKQRIALIRNLIFTPGILLLDEVTSALDSNNTMIVENYIKFLNKEGVTVIWVTHDEEQSKRIFNRKIYIKNGKIEDMEVIERWVQKL